MAGTGFQIPFEMGCKFGIVKGDAEFELPGGVSGCVLALASVVFG
jgi:hypothetical protein